MAKIKDIRANIEVELDDGRKFKYVNGCDPQWTCEGCAFTPDNMPSCDNIPCVGGIYKEVICHDKVSAMD